MAEDVYELEIVSIVVYPTGTLNLRPSYPDTEVQMPCMEGA